MEFQLDGKFKNLSGIIGTSNQSATSATFLVEITNTATGISIWKGDFTQSSISQGLDFPMTGVQRIKIEVTATDLYDPYSSNTGIAAFQLQLFPPTTKQ